MNLRQTSYPVPPPETSPSRKQPSQQEHRGDRGRQRPSPEHGVRAAAVQVAGVEALFDAVFVLRDIPVSFFGPSFCL